MFFKRHQFHFICGRCNAENAKERVPNVFSVCDHRAAAQGKSSSTGGEH